MWSRPAAPDEALRQKRQRVVQPDDDAAALHYAIYHHPANAAAARFLGRWWGTRAPREGEYEALERAVWDVAAQSAQESIDARRTDTLDLTEAELARRVPELSALDALSRRRLHWQYVQHVAYARWAAQLAIARSDALATEVGRLHDEMSRLGHRLVDAERELACARVRMESDGAELGARRAVELRLKEEVAVSNALLMQVYGQQPQQPRPAHPAAHDAERHAHHDAAGAAAEPGRAAAAAAAAAAAPPALGAGWRSDTPPRCGHAHASCKGAADLELARHMVGPGPPIDAHALYMTPSALPAAAAPAAEEGARPHVVRASSAPSIGAMFVDTPASTALEPSVKGGGLAHHVSHWRNGFAASSAPAPGTPSSSAAAVARSGGGADGLQPHPQQRQPPPHSLQFYQLQQYQQRQQLYYRSRADDDDDL